jgi:hypothetical protein
MHSTVYRVGVGTTFSEDTVDTMDAIVVKTAKLEAACTKQDVINALRNAGYHARVTEVTRGLYEILTLDADEDKLTGALSKLPHPLTLHVKQGDDSWQKRPLFETKIDYGVRAWKRLTNDKRPRNDTSDEEEEEEEEYLGQQNKKRRS